MRTLWYLGGSVATTAVLCAYGTGLHGLLVITVLMWLLYFGAAIYFGRQDRRWRRRDDAVNRRPT